MSAVTGYGIASQVFPDFENCFMQGADNFTVPFGSSWSIENIAVFGSVTNAQPPAFSFEVIISNNNGIVPGAIAYFATILNYTLSGDLYEIVFPNPVVLNAGTYWVSVMPTFAFLPGANQWFWARHTGSQEGLDFVWQDPCALATTGYTTFTLQGPFVLETYDLTFALYGQEVSPIPISNWALYLGILLMISFVVIRFRRMI